MIEGEKKKEGKYVCLSFISPFQDGIDKYIKQNREEGRCLPRKERKEQLSHDKYNNSINKLLKVSMAQNVSPKDVPNISHLYMPKKKYLKPLNLQKNGMNEKQKFTQIQNCIQINGQSQQNVKGKASSICNDYLDKSSGMDVLSQNSVLEIQKINCLYNLEGFKEQSQMKYIHQRKKFQNQALEEKENSMTSDQKSNLASTFYQIDDEKSMNGGRSIIEQINVHSTNNNVERSIKSNQKMLTDETQNKQSEKKKNLLSLALNMSLIVQQDENKFLQNSSNNKSTNTGRYHCDVSGRHQNNNLIQQLRMESAKNNQTKNLNTKQPQVMKRKRINSVNVIKREVIEERKDFGDHIRSKMQELNKDHSQEQIKAKQDLIIQQESILEMIYVRVIVLEMGNTTEDITKKQIEFDISPYFKRLIRNEGLQIFDIELLHRVQPYLKDIFQSKDLSQLQDHTVKPSQSKNHSLEGSKYSMIQNIDRYEKGYIKQYQFNYLIKQYFIESPILHEQLMNAFYVQIQNTLRKQYPQHSEVNMIIDGKGQTISNIFEIQVPSQILIAGNSSNLFVIFPLFRNKLNSYVKLTPRKKTPIRIRNCSVLFPSTTLQKQHLLSQIVSYIQSDNTHQSKGI